MTKSASGGSQNSFIDVQKALKGISYPADKQTLLDTAQKNGASDEVKAALDALPDQEYGSPAEVSKEIGSDE